MLMKPSATKTAAKMNLTAYNREKYTSCCFIFCNQSNTLYARCTLSNEYYKY